MATGENNARDSELHRIECERIVLRPWKHRDARIVYKHLNDELLSRHTLVPYPYTISHAEDYIRRVLKHHKVRTSYHFAIELKSSGEVIGAISLFDVDATHKRGEVGCWLARPYWRQGFMTEALNSVLEMAFDSLKLYRVYARTSSANLAAQTLVLTCGFTHEGTMRRHTVRRGKREDDMVFGLLKTEFMRSRRLTKAKHRQQ